MLTKQIKEKFPFLSVIKYGGNEYVGIVINQDQWVTSIYNYGALRSDQEKKLLLDLGGIWWFESNRKIPISVFLKKEIKPLKYCMLTMNTKDVVVVLGPTVNINDLSTKRIKHKSVQLVRNLEE